MSAEIICQNSDRKKRGRPKKAMTDSDICKIMNISRDTLSKSKFLLRYADQETQDKLMRGEIKVNPTYQRLRLAMDAAAMRIAMKDREGPA